MGSLPGIMTGPILGGVPLAEAVKSQILVRRLGVAFKPYRRQSQLLHCPQTTRANPPRCASYHVHWSKPFAEHP